MFTRFLTSAAFHLICWSSLTTLLAQSDRHEFEHAAMGVHFRYILYHDDAELARNLFADAARRVTELDSILSDYREQSETNQLCRSAPHASPQAVSPDLFRVVERSLQFSRLTGGAFDITVGPASHTWRKAIKRKRLPEADKLELLRTAIGSDKLRLAPPNQLQLLAPAMQLDFGGIAQGDAADQVGNLFRAAGVRSALIDASGDLLAIGAPPNQAGWPIEIPGLGDNETSIVWLRDAAISTSGDREQKLVIDGVRYSHIIDPRTARAVEQSLQATVIAPSATTADAIASALCVLTPEQGLALIELVPEAAARLLLRRAPETEESGATDPVQDSPGFGRYLAPHEQR